jgi:hypothetical protein
MTDERLLLSAGGAELVFVRAHIAFEGEMRNNVFATKNNKTLRQTLEHRRYASLAAVIGQQYNGHLDRPLGDFLLERKAVGDVVYRRFLNGYGDLSYRNFKLIDESVKRSRGLYAFTERHELMYVGRCLDAFGKRFNQGYGTIHPKNCFRDGQSTNCHLNALIAAASEPRLFVCWLTDAEEIRRVEADLIRRYQPSWNVQLRDKVSPDASDPN